MIGFHRNIYLGVENIISNFWSHPKIAIGKLIGADWILKRWLLQPTPVVDTALLQSHLQNFKFNSVLVGKFEQNQSI